MTGLTVLTWCQERHPTTEVFSSLEGAKILSRRDYLFLQVAYPSSEVASRSLDSDKPNVVFE